MAYNWHLLSVSSTISVGGVFSVATILLTVVGTSRIGTTITALLTFVIPTPASSPAGRLAHQNIESNRKRVSIGTPKCQVCEMVR